MSKAAKTTKMAMETGYASQTQAVTHAKMTLAGKRTISRDEATRLFASAGDFLDVQFNRMEHNMQAVAAAELAVSDRARQLISTSKDLAAKVGDAMARVDKVVVRDFEAKLSQLERFVAAMKALDELKKSGRLDVLMTAFAKQ